MANRVNVNAEELKDRLVAINRVVKVTKGGRTFTFAAIVVVGDGKGVIGYGLGKPVNPLTCYPVNLLPPLTNSTNALSIDILRTRALKIIYTACYIQHKCLLTHNWPN